MAEGDLGVRVLADLAAHPDSKAGAIAARLDANPQIVLWWLNDARSRGLCERYRASKSTAWRWRPLPPRPGSRRVSRPGDGWGDIGPGDPETMRFRLLAAQCSTCVGRPGNLMRLNPGRLRDLVSEAKAADGYIVCHQTLPGAPPGVRPAICRWFYDRYGTAALQIAGRMFGFTEVPPPGKD